MLVQIAQIQAFFLAMVEMEMDLSRPEKSDILKSLQLFVPPQKFSFKKKKSPEIEGQWRFPWRFSLHSSFGKKKDLFYFICRVFCLHTHLCTLCILSDCRSSRTEDGCKLPCGWWELSLGSLKAQPVNCVHVLLTTEPLSNSTLY